MMLYVTVPSVLMTLLSTLIVIRHLICSNSERWLLTLNLIYKTLDWCRKRLVDLNSGKTQRVFDGAIDVKMDGYVLEEKSYLKMLGLSFSCKFLLSKLRLVNP